MSGERILLVGCGKQAEKHIQGLRKAGLDDIVLFDIQPELAKSLGERMSLPVVGDVDATLAEDAVAAIDICTPTPSHYPLLKAAFTAGKHAFCEKPLCETVEQARELVALAEANGSKCGVGFIYRFAPSFELLKELTDGVGQGAEHPLGRIVCATLKVGGRGSHAVWKHRAETGGGAINEMLVHMLDLALWLFGPSGDVELLVERLLQPERTINGEKIVADAEDYVVLRATLGGVESLIEADLVTPAFLQQVLVQGENGTFMGSIQPSMPNALFLIKERGAFKGGNTPLTFTDNDLFAKQMSDFAKMLREPDHQPRCRMDESLRLMELIEEVRARREPKAARNSRGTFPTNGGSPRAVGPRSDI